MLSGAYRFDGVASMAADRASRSAAQLGPSMAQGDRKRSAAEFFPPKPPSAAAARPAALQQRERSALLWPLSFNA